MPDCHSCLFPGPFGCLTGASDLTWSECRIFLSLPRNPHISLSVSCLTKEPTIHSVVQSPNPGTIPGCSLIHIPTLILLALLPLFLSSIGDKGRKSFLIPFNVIMSGSVATVTGKQTLIVGRRIYCRDFWEEMPRNNAMHPCHIITYHRVTWW